MSYASQLPEVTTGSDGGGLPLAVPVFAEMAGVPADVDLVAADPYLKAQRFTGKLGEVAMVPGDRPLLLVGLGDEVDAEGLRRAAGSLARAASKLAAVATTLHHVEIDGAAQAVIEGFLLGAYRFTSYKSGDDDAPPNLHLVERDGQSVEEEVDRALVVAAAVFRARDLVNTPARDKAPASVADDAREMAEAVGADVRIWGEDELAAAGFGGLVGVNAGSERPARMVQLSWAPEGARSHLVLVGKGIIFDSGGLSLKPYESMKDMKDDMAGAASVIAAFEAIARLKLPVKVTAITPLTENMPSGGATRPGDVLTAYNGKTMEVLNTDAEGRLVLADGLSMGAEAAPDLMVDLATLTGACKVALGSKIAGLFAVDDQAASMVQAAADAAGERVWRLPMPSDYRTDIDSEVADMKNVAGTRYGGALHAALFLSEFVGDTPWVHLDIAGPAMPGKAEFYQGEGASGFGVRTLVALAEAMAAD